jgi:hypothetical protein
MTQPKPRGAKAKRGTGRRNKSKPDRGGPKFTPSEREDVLDRVAELDRRGYSQRMIADDVGVSQPTVGDYLKTIRARYIERQMEHRGAQVAEKRLQYRELRQAAWLAWERSKDDATRVVQEAGESPGGANSKTVTTTEGRLPAVHYLQLVFSCLKAERELLGLDQPTKIDMRQMILDWDRLAGEASGALRDEVEAEIERASIPVEYAPALRGDGRAELGSGSGSGAGSGAEREGVPAGSAFDVDGDA